MSRRPVSWVSEEANAGLKQIMYHLYNDIIRGTLLLMCCAGVADDLDVGSPLEICSYLVNPQPLTLPLSLPNHHTL